MELLGASFTVRISTPLDADSLCARHAEEKEDCVTSSKGYRTLELRKKDAIISTYSEPVLDRAFSGRDHKYSEINISYITLLCSLSTRQAPKPSRVNLSTSGVSNIYIKHLMTGTKGNYAC